MATDWQPGDFIDVSSGSFDSLSLHCYVLVGISGTSDDVLIKIETRPLRDLSFTIDQTIEQTISSSLATEKIYRDDIHRKTINYGDISLKEIGWTIPVDLKNVKDLRISVKQKNGQLEEQNKKFIAFGRFVKSSNETEEV